MINELYNQNYSMIVLYYSNIVLNNTIYSNNQLLKRYDSIHQMLHLDKQVHNILYPDETIDNKINNKILYLTSQSNINITNIKSTMINDDKDILFQEDYDSNYLLVGYHMKGIFYYYCHIIINIIGYNDFVFIILDRKSWEIYQIMEYMKYL